MKPKHSLQLLLVSLCFGNVVRCDNIVITTRRSWQYGGTETIDIMFSLQRFRRFYECLCKTTTRQCSVTLLFSTPNTCYATNVQRSDHQVQPNEENLHCKYYQCSYSSSFVCTTEASHSCESSPRMQSMQYRSADCGDTKCVSISWEFPEENVDYSSFPSIVYSCNNSCGCSTRAPVRPTSITTTTERPHSSTEKQKTSSTSKQTTTSGIQKTSQAETTLQTTATENPSKITTTQETGDNTETNTTTSGLASDKQRQELPVPMIVGIVVSLILVASVAAVVIFLWKRKKGAAQKPASECHEYANLPSASGRAKGVDTTNAVNLSQDLASQYTNYATVNASFDYDCDEAKYATLTNKSNDNTVQTGNQQYVNWEPHRIRAVAPKEPNQTKDTSTGISGGHVTVINTLGETDDFTNSIYELAHHCPATDPGHAGVSITNTKTNLLNLHSKNRTDEPISNDKHAVVTTRSHTHKDNTNENDTSCPTRNTYTHTKRAKELQNLEQATHYVHDYESAKQTKGTISNSDSVYSLSNDNVDSDTTYSMATNSTSDMGDTDTSRPHVYAHLGSDTHNIPNPYNSLQQANEASVPTQAKPQNITLGTSSDTIQPYSLAEPIYEYQIRSDNDNSYQVIDSTDDDDERCVDTYTTPYENAAKGISPELFNKSNNPSSCEMPNNIYFELEK